MTASDFGWFGRKACFLPRPLSGRRTDAEQQPGLVSEALVKESGALAGRRPITSRKQKAVERMEPITLPRETATVAGTHQTVAAQKTLGSSVRFNSVDAARAPRP